MTKTLPLVVFSMLFKAVASAQNIVRIKTHKTAAWTGLVMLIALIVFTLPAATQSESVGSFEIDGNLVDDPPGEPIDWSTDPAGNTPHPGLFNRLDFQDGSGQGDDIFGQGSKELAPGAWSCLTGSAPGKDDIVRGSIAIRAIGQKRFMYVNFFRKSPNGDAHMDYEFNQSVEKNPACPALHKRTQGDVLIAFDTEQGGSIILVRAFKWVGNASVGTFEPLALGTKGILWDAAVNIPNTIPGAQAGVYGEAVINLTDSPLQLLCPEFSYMKTRASTAINSELKDRTLPQRIVFGDHPELANARKSAFGVSVSSPMLGISQKLVEASSSQQGVGSNRDEDRLLNVTVPNPVGGVGNGNIVKADLVVASSQSTITEAPAQATHTSIAEVANLNILNGLITADVVRAEATAIASGSASSFSSIGSTFKNLRVANHAINDVAPNTRVELPAMFGVGSFVILYERVGSTTTPFPGQISGGIYTAELTVNMIHLFITDLQPSVLGKQSVEVIISNGIAEVDFPQTDLCGIPPDQTVSGHAFVASAATDPPQLPTTVGFVSIPPNGGLDHQNLDEVAIAGSVEAGASQSESSGALTSKASNASSFSQVSGVCLAPAGSSCTASATVVKSQSNSSAQGSGVSSSNSAGTQLVGLVVMGTPISANPPPNTVIDLPGIGFLIVNEQFCDNQATLGSNCSDGAVFGHAGLTVRALRLEVTVPGNALGLNTGQVIVAESHSDAFRK